MARGAFVQLLLMSLVLGTSALLPTAEDCTVYDVTTNDLNKTFANKLSIGLQPQGHVGAAELHLTSLASNDSCRITAHTAFLIAECSDGVSSIQKDTKWPMNVIKKNDLTEIWLKLDYSPSDEEDLKDPRAFQESITKSEDSVKDSTAPEAVSPDLHLVWRRGKYRGHFLFSKSGLKPPVSLEWKKDYPVKYYYDCITGCLNAKTQTVPGADSFYLRPAEDFQEVVITYPSKNGEKTLRLNKANVGSTGIWKNISVVWNTESENIAALIDGTPVEDLPDGGQKAYTNLQSSKQLKVSLSGGDYLSLCDEELREMAAGMSRGNEQEIKREMPPKVSGNNDEARSWSGRSLAVHDEGDTAIPSAVWPLTFLLVVALTFLIISIVLSVLLFRSTREIQKLRSGATISPDGETPAVLSYSSLKKDNHLQGLEDREGCYRSMSVDTEMTADAKDMTLTVPPASPTKISTRDLFNVDIMENSVG